MRIALIIFLLFSTTLTHAKLFRYADPVTGNITFSNLPIPKKKGGAGNGERDPVRSSGARTTTAFPRVSPQIQRLRDMDRRKILQAELKTEKEALQAAMSKQSAADLVHRHEMNIAALEREIRNVK